MNKGKDNLNIFVVILNIVIILISIVEASVLFLFKDKLSGDFIDYIIVTMLLNISALIFLNFMERRRKILDKKIEMLLIEHLHQQIKIKEALRDE